jgi:hypothetical protein
MAKSKWFIVLFDRAFIEEQVYKVWCLNHKMKYFVRSPPHYFFFSQIWLKSETFWYIFGHIPIFLHKAAIWKQVRIMKNNLCISRNVTRGPRDTSFILLILVFLCDYEFDPIFIYLVLYMSGNFHVHVNLKFSV